MYETKFGHHQYMEDNKTYRVLIQQLPATVFTFDQQGIITFYNTAAAELLGALPETGIHKFTDFMGVYKNDGSKFANNNSTLFESHNIPQNNTEVTVKRHKDGKQFRLLCSSRVLNKENDGTDGVLVVLTDISTQNQLRLANNETETETEKNETLFKERELFETVLNASADAIFVNDKNGRFITLNKKCEELFKISRKETIGKSYSEIFPNGAENSDSYQHFLKALDGEHVHNVITKSNTLDYSFEVFIIPLFRNNEIKGVLTIVHDITSLIKVSERLQLTNRILEEKNKELERSNNELASFSYIASHDLQEPLRKIITFADKLLEVPEINSQPATKTYLAKIIASSERMRQLIEDVLNFSRISTEEKFTKTNLNEVISNVLTDFEHKIAEKKATINVGELPIIPAINLQMRQLFHNLISNALKFSASSRNPVIKITCEPLTLEELLNHSHLNKSISYVKIAVSDNGIGFKQEFSEKIFIIFQRLHGNSSFPGTGIGLALCRKITENHNGLIYASSNEGKGTTFYIVLPEKLGFNS